MHCWCPPTTGPGQPHEPDCSRYKRLSATIGEYADWALTDVPVKLDTGPFFGHGLQYSANPYEAKLSDVQMQTQAYNHALQWLAKQDLKSKSTSIGCTCAAKYGVVGHAAFCPIGERAESDAADAADEVVWTVKI